MSVNIEMNQTLSKGWGDDGGGGKVPEHETVLFHGAAAAYIDETLQGPDAPDSLFEVTGFMPDDDAVYRPSDVCAAPYAAPSPPNPEAEAAGPIMMDGGSIQTIYWLDRAHEAFGVCEVSVPGEMNQSCTCTFRPLLANIEVGCEIAMSADGTKVYFLENNTEDHRAGRLWAYIVGSREITEILTGLCRPRGLYVTLGNDLVWIEDSYSASEGPSVRLLPAPCARAASFDNLQNEHVIGILRFPVKGDLIAIGKHSWEEQVDADGSVKDDGSMKDNKEEESEKYKSQQLHEQQLMKFGRPEQLVVLSDDSIVVSVRDTSTSSSSLIHFPSPQFLADFSSEEEATAAVCTNPLLPKAAVVPSEIPPIENGFRFDCHVWIARDLPPTRRMSLCPKSGSILMAGCGAVEVNGFPTSLLRLVRKDKEPERLMGGFASSLCLDRNGNVFVCPARGGGLRAFWYRGTDRWSLLAAQRAAKVPLPLTARSESGNDPPRSHSKSSIHRSQLGKSSSGDEQPFDFRNSLLNTSGLSVINARKESDDVGVGDDTIRENIVHPDNNNGDQSGLKNNYSEELLHSTQHEMREDSSFFDDDNCDEGDGNFCGIDDNNGDDAEKEKTQLGHTMESVSSSLIEDSEEGAEVTVPLFLDRTNGNVNDESQDAEASKSSVAVVLRCRPLLPKEKEAKLRRVVKVDMNRDEVYIMGKPRIFKFSRVYDETTSQRRVFHETIAPLVDKVLTGYSATCFAYGPTGSGKTYTMEGPPAELRTWNEFSQTVQATGMITRAIHMLFHALARSESVVSHRVSVSHLEVYNESLYDLLAVSNITGDGSSIVSSPNKSRATSPEKNQSGSSNKPKSAFQQKICSESPVLKHGEREGALKPQSAKNGRSVTMNFRERPASSAAERNITSGTQLADERLQHLMRPLKLLEDARTGIQKVSGLTQMDVLNPIDIFRVLRRSTRARFTAETKLNRHSSRSHSIFTINVEMKCSSSEQGNVMKRGKLSLVDLCGSENIKKSGSEGQRAVEAGHIGKSLLVLGRVIRSIIQHDPHVPYRDSKLTRLLSNALGGDAYTVLILNSAPGVNQQEETMNTLKYAELAQGIVNNPHAHVEQLPDDDTDMEEARLQKQHELEEMAEAEAVEEEVKAHNTTAWVRPWSASVPMRTTRTLRKSVSASEVGCTPVGFAQNGIPASASTQHLPPLCPETLMTAHASSRRKSGFDQSAQQSGYMKERYAFHRETSDWVKENVFSGDGKLSYLATIALREIFDRHDIDRDGLLSIQEMAGLCALWPTDVTTQSDLLTLVPARKHHLYKLNFSTLIQFVQYLGENDLFAVRHLFSTCGYSLSLYLVDAGARKAAQDRRRESSTKATVTAGVRRGSLKVNKTAKKKGYRQSSSSSSKQQ